MTDLLNEYWDWFLFDTLLWTGALIALVMVLRRPVARLFGAGAAYALWFLPLARLVVPPFTLPSWMRPARDAQQEAEPVFAFGSDAIAMPVPDPGMAEPSFVLAPVADVAPEAPVDLLTPLIVLWLVGAAIMLVRRFWLYFQLRSELLTEARPVGEVGSIRLIETPAISGPMAFGVIDRVIALPDGFMASRERAQRDLAIEHELAHHRGGDLLVNMAVQPLFAIHWFNPVGWLGWHALRRDQEAYCDARVVASRSREDRATYAGIIAEFARRPAPLPRPALAAPMACPVLGDKSIIHRLRSLSMSDISPRRRLAGRAAIASAFLAIPLTASICYAEGTPRLLVASAQAAETQVDEWKDVDFQPEPEELAEMEREIEEEFDEAEREMREAEIELEGTAAEIAELERELAEAGDELKEGRRVSYNGKEWSQLSASERREIREDLARTRQQLAENGAVRLQMEELKLKLGEDGELRRDVRLALAEARAETAKAGALAPRVISACKDEYIPVTSETDADGKTTLYVCETAGDAIALRAMRQARLAIASEKSLGKEQRREALRELDREIAALEARN